MKKYRIKKKNFAIFIIILLFIIIEFINPFRIISYNQLKKMKYSESSINMILKLGLKNTLVDYKYSSFVDHFINSNDFNKDYIDYYVKLSYNKHLNNIKYINKLIELGYKDSVVCSIANGSSDDEVKNFLNNQLTSDSVIDLINNDDKNFKTMYMDKGYSKEDILDILESGDNNKIKNLLIDLKYKDIEKYLKYDFAHLDNISSYIEYNELNVCTIEESIINVNLGLEREPYIDFDIVSNFSEDIIVNKYNKLSDNFEVNNLVNIPSMYTTKNLQASRVVVLAFTELFNNAKEETGLSFKINDAYRSNEYQTKTYNDWAKNYGEKSALKYVAKPGFSEHETGLAINIAFSSNDEDVVYNWLSKNAYKYGFIIRYSKKKEDITGFREEKTHLRYVGRDISKIMYENNYCLEEYIARYGK